MEDDAVPLPAAVVPAWRRSRRRGRRRPVAEAYGRQQDMRFDCDARVEVWVTQDDLEDDQRIAAIKAENIPLEQKISKAKAVAAQIAGEHLSEFEGAGNRAGYAVEVTADTSPTNVNVDRIDWVGLLEPRSEEE
jgi:hypothetical protein